MRNLSLVVLFAALVLGVLAVTGVRGLLQSRPGPAAQSSDDAVAVSTVVVARQPLEFGTELTPEVLREVAWPKNARPDGAFSSVNELLGSERRVALRSIAPNEPVLKDKISGYGGRAALSQIIEEGMRAVTIRVNDVSGAGGFVLPGDRVDVLHTVSPNNIRIETVTNILLQDIRVLAIDQIADESQEGAIVVKAATLEVTPLDAQKIALASEVGQLSLTLRNSAVSDEDEEIATRTVRYGDLNPSQPVKQTTAAPTPSPYGSVRITRGMSRSTQSVVRERNNTQATTGSLSRARFTAPPTSSMSSTPKFMGASPDAPQPAEVANSEPTALTPQD
mgnify:FL=1